LPEEFNKIIEEYKNNDGYETKENESNHNNETQNEKETEQFSIIDKLNDLNDLNDEHCSKSSKSESINNKKEIITSRASELLQTPKFEPKNNILNISKESLNDFIKIKKNVVKPLKTPKKFNFKPEKNDYDNNVSSNVDYNEIIKNVQDDDEKNMKSKRSKIIIITQYIENFQKELKTIYGNNKDTFCKKLYTLNLAQLNIIHENIKCSLNIKRNFTLFNNTLQVFFNSVEKMISVYLQNDCLIGTYDDLLKNDIEFNYTLKMLSCEHDLSKYLSPKLSLIIHLLKSYYMKYAMLKINNTKNIDPNKLSEFQNKLKNILNNNIINKV